MADKWIWVIRKANKEAIRIVDTDFDPELYELQEPADASSVAGAIEKKNSDAKSAAENAEKVEKNAAVKKGRSKKADEK